ncbi:hypothetical protein [Alkalihalobacillus sp. LMS39]|uniref:hypothetical protein n=1 Tax=Alkalihalobacillus sp. LMS39 TaxID=2924032 RepID=UPI001FB259C5|nr:hypothetical protein [Alkalihalobacillus sp. LMS39]UOE92012.1 hypothetical protein MM271_12095 [Alkalihalobacillus sp. LMS39]
MEKKSKGYAGQLFIIVKQAKKKGISYEDATSQLMASNPLLEKSAKNTTSIKNILEKFVELGKMNKTRSGNYQLSK